MFRALLACLILGVAASAAAEPVTVLQSTGSSINRLDLVVMGDGYTAAELASGKYASDVAAAMNGFFTEPPYNEYSPYFNVYRVEVASAESGVDHPARGVLRNTALDAAYDCAGITRLICVNTSKVNAILASSLPAPTARDLILVLVNDPEYGGSGGAVAVSSTHSAAVQLVLHEVGHTLAQLADEYDGPNPPACNNTVEPSAVNVTMATLRENVKWNASMNPATPVPTGGTTNGVPGLFRAPSTASPACSARPTTRRCAASGFHSTRSTASSTSNGSTTSCRPSTARRPPNRPSSCPRGSRVCLRLRRHFPSTIH